MRNYYDWPRCTQIGLDVHSREVHSCESVFVAENDEGYDQRGRINSDHAGRIDAPARALQRELRPGRKSHSRPGLGLSAFFVARELARLKTSSRSDRCV